MIAVDANGADQGPAAVAEGARRSGTSTLVFGPEAELGEGIEVVDAPEAIEAGASRSAPCASARRPRSCRRRKRWQTAAPTFSSPPAAPVPHSPPPR